MRIFLSFFVLAMASLACSPISNRYDGMALDCGGDFRGRKPVSIWDPDGTRLSGGELEAFALTSEGRKELALSSKGCLEQPSTEVLIRHKHKSLGFAGELPGTLIVLKRPEEPRLKAACIGPSSARTSLNLQNFLNLHDVAHLQSYELLVNLAAETSLRSSLQAKVSLSAQDLSAFPLPADWPEGPFKLTLTLHDLIRHEDDTVSCPLMMDRTAPEPEVDVQVSAEHVRGPQLLTEVDDRRTLQLTSNEGQIFYCLQKSADAPCEPSLLYEKPLSLSAWQGEVLLRYRAVDPAGNASPIRSKNMLIANTFQESEVASLATSSRSVAGQSLQAMLDALTAEEKRRLMPSGIQRERHSLSTYWALLKNHLAPNAPLLTVPFSQSKTTAYWNDISVDGQWLCSSDLSNQVQLFRVRDQERTTLPFEANACRLSPHGDLMLAAMLHQESTFHLVQRSGLIAQSLPSLKAEGITQIHLDEQSQVFVASSHRIFKWTPATPDTWKVLYESEKKFNANFGPHAAVLWFDGGMSVFDPEFLHKQADIPAENLNIYSSVSISPDGRILMAVPDPFASGPIEIWQWDEEKNIHERSADFDPYQRHAVRGVVIGPQNDEVLLEHSNGTASHWGFSKGRFLLHKTAIGIPGDIIQNVAIAQQPRARFLEGGRLGIISASHLSVLRGQAAGMVLASGLKEIVVDDKGSTVLTQDSHGRVSVHAFDGAKLENISVLHELPSNARNYKALHISGSGQVVAVKVGDKLKLWQRHASGFLPLDHPAGDLSISAAALSHDGRGLAVGERRNDKSFVNVWIDGHLQKTRSVFCLPPDSIFPKDAYTLKFSPQGDRLLISCNYGEAQIWNWRSDELTTIGPDIAISSGLFHENGKDLIFDNGTVMQTETFAVHSWNEGSGITSYSLNTDPIQTLSGSRDFRLIGALSNSDLVFWNPELNDRSLVWENLNTLEWSVKNRLSIASDSMRAFVLNQHDELIYWPLSVSDIYLELCRDLMPQIHAQGMQENICQAARL